MEHSTSKTLLDSLRIKLGFVKFALLQAEPYDTVQNDYSFIGFSHSVGEQHDIHSMVIF